MADNDVFEQRNECSSKSTGLRGNAWAKKKVSANLFQLLNHFVKSLDD